MNRRLLVDLEALTANYEHFKSAAVQDRAADREFADREFADREFADREVGAVVKADGYGLGAAVVAARLAEAGCRSFFVATAGEALTLAQSLSVPAASIYVLEGPDGDTADRLAAAGIVPVINHSGQLDCWRDHASAPVAVQVDTGMARLGFDAELSPGLLEGFRVCLLLTHLACADEPDHPANERQLARFERVRSRFPGVRTSIGNSAGWLNGKAYQGDLARPGFGLYGGNPFCDRPNPMRPVACLQGRILQLRELPAGTTVGYGATFETRRPTRVATVALGYADGVPRLLSNRGSMALGGARCPIIGRISMDTTMIDVSDTDAAVGDWAECFGPAIPIEEAAGWAGTIAYELLTGVGPRVTRQYAPDRLA